MKKIYLLLLFFCLFGKSYAIGPVQINPFIGINTAFFTDLDNASNVIGFQGGVMTRIDLGETFYVGPGIMYLTQGVNTRDFNMADDKQRRLDVSGVQVPLLFGIKVIDLEVTSLNIGLGPAATFATNYEYDSDDLQEFYEEDLNKALWGLKAEASIQITALTLGVDYEVGLSRISKAAESPKIGRLGFNVGVAF